MRNLVSHSPMKITIITVVFNNKDLIKNAIDSVGCQKDVEVEHLIIDGASTDGTLEYIKSLNIPNLKVHSEKDKGIYDALNKGISKASGDIIGILHSDDFYTSESVLKKIHDLIQTGSDVIYADLEYVQRDDTNKIFRKWKSGNFNKTNLMFGWVAPHPTVFVKKSVYNEIGLFNLDYRISGDYDFILRVFLNKKFKVTYLPETVVKMRLGGESTKSLKSYWKGSKQDYSIAKKHFLFPLITVFSKVTRKIPQLIFK